MAREKALCIFKAGAGCTKVLAVTLANGDRMHHDGCSGKLWVFQFNQKKQWYEEVKANEFKR